MIVSASIRLRDCSSYALYPSLQPASCMQRRPRLHIVTLSSVWLSFQPMANMAVDERRERGQGFDLTTPDVLAGCGQMTYRSLSLMHQHSMLFGIPAKHGNRDECDRHNGSVPAVYFDASRHGCYHHETVLHRMGRAALFVPVRIVR